MNIEQSCDEELHNQSDKNTGFDYMKSLPNLLRLLGTGALLIAMYSFLVRGWDSGNDVLRYFLMLGHTGALAAIGVASGIWLKESKGARLLLTLAVVSVPVNFAILGAFVFSQFVPVDMSQYPNYVAWSVDSMSAGLWTTGIAVLALIPIIFLGFRVLARSVSMKLSALFLFSNLMLLVPLRDPQLVTVLVLLLSIFIVVFSRQATQGNTVVKTNEGVTALGLQFLPLAILMGRSLWLYSLDMFLVTALFITVFLLMRQMRIYLDKGSKWHSLLGATAVITAVLTIIPLGSAMYEAMYISKEIILPLSTLVAYAMIYDLSRQTDVAAGAYRKIAIVVLVIGMLINLTMFTSPMTSLLCILIGLGIVVHGYKFQQRSSFTSGIVLMAVGLIYQFYSLVHYFDLGSWMGLASLGIASIVIASTIETQGKKIRPKIESWKLELQRWEQ